MVRFERPGNQAWPFCFSASGIGPTLPAMADETVGFEGTFAGGLVGTATVAALHQVSRHLLKDAPRLDVMGERMIEKGFARFGRAPPKQTKLLSWALGNVGTDTLVFAAVGFG